MNEYEFNVTISCADAEKANIVMLERINYDVDYGFDYQITFEGK